MVTLSLCAVGGGISVRNPHKPSSYISTIPSKNAFFTTTPHRNHCRSLSVSVKSQSWNRQEQNHQQQQRFSSPDTPSSLPGQSPPRVYVGHSIYKGKAALTVEPRPPEFSSLDSGAFRLSKEGFVLLQFAPAVGARQYDWGRKQVFSLNVSEIGSIISLGARDSCEFFHDPMIGRSDEGKVRKLLKVEPFPDGSGHFFNLSVQNKFLNVDENIYIPITKAEFSVLISSFNFILPYLLGWHAFANTIKPEDSNRANDVNTRCREGRFAKGCAGSFPHAFNLGPSVRVRPKATKIVLHAARTIIAKVAD
ncbi:Single-stranded DNA-binding protein WHY1-chloroplastic [Striga hermonthica]|uniref:Single-stranded DNA-binding protein WHY1-chloroplastic n=1 Tax=Striga hermonthica TaxID=68872 RepID=A0A9N7NHH4_STRHE|nr:Single-stranded DNA-binding protein WHY1-chloroplastic [Striga hermonthica]